MCAETPIQPESSSKGAIVDAMCCVPHGSAQHTGAVTGYTETLPLVPGTDRYSGSFSTPATHAAAAPGSTHHDVVASSASIDPLAI